MRERKKLLLIALFAVSTIMVSCSKDGQISCDMANNFEVNFTSNIITMSPRLKMGGNSWNTNDKIGVYMLDHVSTDIVESKENILFVAQSDDVVGIFKAQSSKIYFPDNGQEVRFMAYYPYQETVTNGIYKVDVSDQTSQSNIDLLHSFKVDTAYSKNNSSKKIPLIFKHQLTKIIINVKEGQGISIDDLSDLTVQLSGLNTLADFNLMNKSLINPSAVDTITTVKTLTQGEYVASYEAIIIPMDEVTEGSQMVFNLKDGSVFTWNFNEALNSSTKYVYNVTINRSEIVVEATINDWEEGGNNDISAE